METNLLPNKNAIYKINLHRFQDYSLISNVIEMFAVKWNMDPINYEPPQSL